MFTLIAIPIAVAIFIYNRRMKTLRRRAAQTGEEVRKSAAIDSALKWAQIAVALAAAYLVVKVIYGVARVFLGGQ